MKLHSKLITILVFAGAILWPAQAAEKEKESLDPRLEAFRPFLGKTWRGEMAGSTKDKPQVDISRYERALNGQAIRALHSINDGAYGGESIIFWDKTKQQVVYYYFTTAGFYTTGSMTITQGKYVSLEKVTGDSDGVTEVRGTGEIRPDGTLVTSSEYLKQGKWVPGHGAVYREDSKAEVKFK